MFANTGLPSARKGNTSAGKRPKGNDMYIGGGVLALIVLIVLLIWLF